MTNYYITNFDKSILLIQDKINTKLNKKFTKIYFNNSDLIIKYRDDVLTIFNPSDIEGYYYQGRINMNDYIILFKYLNHFSKVK